MKKLLIIIISVVILESAVIFTIINMVSFDPWHNYYETYENVTLAEYLIKYSISEKGGMPFDTNIVNQDIHNVISNISNNSLYVCSIIHENHGRVDLDYWDNLLNILYNNNGMVILNNFTVQQNFAVWSSGCNGKNEFGKGDDINCWEPFNTQIKRIKKDNWKKLLFWNNTDSGATNSNYIKR